MGTSRWSFHPKFLIVNELNLVFCRRNQKIMIWFFILITVTLTVENTSSMHQNINQLSQEKTPATETFKSYKKDQPYFVEGQFELPSKNDFAKNVMQQVLIPLVTEHSPPVMPQLEKVFVKNLEDIHFVEQRSYSCDSESEVEVRCYGSFLDIPENLTDVLEKLTIVDAGITTIKRDSFLRYRSTLRDVYLVSLPHLSLIEEGSFALITNLRTVYIKEAPKLLHINGLLYGVTSRNLKNLGILHTGIVEVTNLFYEENIIDMVDLDSNKIEKISTNSIKINANQMSMNFNEITSIENYAFNGSQIGKLHFNGNRKLRTLYPEAFAGMKTLIELDLSSTGIEALPVTGLEELEVLKIQETPTLKTIPSIYDLAKLKRAALTHSFHCCAFKYPEQHHPQKHAEYQQRIRKLCPIDTGQPQQQVPGTPATPAKRRRRRHDRKPRSDRNDEGSDDADNWGESVGNVGLSYENHQSLHQDVRMDDALINGSSDWGQNPLTGKTIAHQEAKHEEKWNEEQGFFHNTAELGESKAIEAYCGKLSTRPPTECTPEPNALNPCEDIMGSSWLRISVWFVVVLAVVGNLAVVIVVLFSGTEINVSRFLICNLAFADFCMGLYLLLLAAMDLHSMGTYFNFAFDWQYGLGCQLAGFLTVFASHLSIFTLTVVTLERWVAITYAIHLTRRIRIGAAAKTMLGGWIYSILIAALPVLGISNYSSTSICLPMEVNTIVDKAYLYAMIIVNGLAFILIVFCYAQIYFSLGYETRRANTKGEMTIAKKMALLIFTDFATWAPIAFFGLTALAGYPLITIPRSKILLVFFYPLNACANPYLYALMTAQYRRDFFQMISRCGFSKKGPSNYTVTTSLRVSNNSHPVPLLTKTNGNCQSVKTDFDDVYV
ncbi:unnamed protein product [Brassicogethes aeneus]|uniref:G-protein coupled receptors family 1 profile domain-containing protein n=1 Tax=Brassicogethes aeneus TaxID=1431903 RepID=A0A9P0AXW2_BRAAE|nr:unnamed protein product [Brassicogethes aeneus]